MTMSHRTLAQGVGACHTIHVSCACVFDLSSTLSLRTLHLSLPSSTSSSWSFTSSSMWMLPEADPLCDFAEWGVWPFGQQRASHRLWAQTSWTTTTSQRPLKSSSRSPPATRGPRTCMSRRSVTTPSAERSLHHCSLRSGKNQRAVDKLITLLTKVCCQVSRCLSVMYERRDLLMSLVR